jgi:hypothetical protein
MTKAPPINPTEDIRAMIRERRIDDRILYARTYLSDVASGAAPIPVTDRTRLRTLAHALGCEPRYLDRVVAEWRSYQAGVPIEEPAAAPAPRHDRDRAKLTQKAITADAQKATLPRKTCTGPCRQLLPITEFYQHGGQCKACRRARATAYREAHPKPKRRLPGVVLNGTYWPPPTS